MINDFKNWQEYFRWRIIKADKYYFDSEYIVNQTNIEIYKSKNNKTYFDIGYIDNFSRLIYLFVINPITIALTQYQKNIFQYYEQGMFDEPSKHGSPGLLFKDNNLSFIENILINGFKGTETHYFLDDKIVKSAIVFIDDKCDEIPYVFYHDSLTTRVYNKLFGNNAIENIKTENIDLQSIFNGVD